VSIKDISAVKYILQFAEINSIINYKPLIKDNKSRGDNMNNSSRFISVFLAVVLLAAIIAGCGSEGGGSGRHRRNA
jgi:hypothetical protein